MSAFHYYATSIVVLASALRAAIMAVESSNTAFSVFCAVAACGLLYMAGKLVREAP